MFSRAWDTAEEYRHKLSNSIRKGCGTLAGCLGEEIFQKIYPIERVNNYDYDFRNERYTFDIKTKERTVAPRTHYECSVNLMNGKQKVDYYVFAQVMNDYQSGWLLGYIRSEKFFEQAVFHPKGSRDGRFRFHCDTYNLPISKLQPFKKKF